MSINGWKACLLGDVLTFQRGHDLPKTKMICGEYPVVGSNGIIGYHNEYTTEAPSVTVGRSGNTGNPFIVYDQSWSHNTTLYVKEFKNSDPVFVYYLLKTLDLGNFSGGSAVPTLNRNHIHSLEISVPPFSEQIEIGRTLKLLDDKIANNTAINHHLEQMAQAMFKSWFVDFEPFGGKIPTDWREGTLGEYCSIKSGFAFKSSWWQEKGIRVIKIKNITDGTFDFSDCSFVSDDKIFYAKNFIATPGDLLIAMTGATIGKFAIIPQHDETLLVNQRVGKFFLGVNPLEKLPFLWGFLKQDGVFNEIVNRGQGSAQPNISPTDIMTIPAIIPLDDTLADFNSNLRACFEIMTTNTAENQKLATLRDTLLPRLMSGELSVADLGDAK